VAACQVLVAACLPHHCGSGGMAISTGGGVRRRSQQEGPPTIFTHEIVSCRQLTMWHRLLYREASYKHAKTNPL